MADNRGVGHGCTSCEPDNEGANKKNPPKLSWLEKVGVATLDILFPSGLSCEPHRVCAPARNGLEHVAHAKRLGSKGALCYTRSYAKSFAERAGAISINGNRVVIPGDSHRISDANWEGKPFRPESRAAFADWVPFPRHAFRHAFAGD